MTFRIEAKAHVILWAGIAVLVTFPVVQLSTGAYESFLASVSLLTVGLIGLVAIYRHPFLGLALLLLACMASPVQIGPLPSAAVIAALLAFAYALKVLLARPTIEVSRPVVPLLAFLTIASVSFLSGQFPWFQATPAPLKSQLGGLGIFWLSGLTFLLVLYQVQRLDHLKKLTWLFLSLGAFIFLGYAVPGGMLIVRFTGATAGSLFWIWFISLALGQSLFNLELHRITRIALLGVVLFALSIRVFAVSSSVSGWLPSVIAVLVVIAIGAPKLAIATSLFVSSVVVIYLEPIVDKVWAQEQYSLVTRWEALKTLWNVVRANPILGLGPSNYYFYTEMFPLMGWYVKFNSHNNYLDLLAQTGFAGLACFFWFAIEVARSGWNQLAGLRAGFERAFILGALGGLSGTLAAGALGDWFLPFVYNIGLSGLKVSLIGWFFLGGLVALEQMRNAASYEASRMRLHSEQPSFSVGAATAR